MKEVILKSYEDFAKWFNLQGKEGYTELRAPVGKLHVKVDPITFRLINWEEFPCGLVIYYNLFLTTILIRFIEPIEYYMDKQILDACCGPRGFWFDKNHPNVLYVDQRMIEEYTTGEGKDKRTRSVVPDKIMDFRSLDLPSNSFRMVVFDPPHLFVGENSYMGKIYGALDKQNWESDISKGFSECFRVLEDGGFLIFKWNESDVPLKKILSLTEHKPLFGHPSGKAQKTHWVCFMKAKLSVTNKIKDL